MVPLHLAVTTVIFTESSFPPIAVGFFGLATGYLVYGTQELLGYPSPPDRKVNLTTGLWGVWMPGFMQFFAGAYLFAGLTWFGSFDGNPALYMAALAFTAYGVHWFALGLERRWVATRDPTRPCASHSWRYRYWAFWCSSITGSINRSGVCSSGSPWCT
jgi:hypothetical protein